MNHRLLPILALTAATMLGCKPDVTRPTTLLTKEGRREFGITGLRVQCQPQGYGISVRFGNKDNSRDQGDLYTPESSFTLFLNGPHLAFHRVINNQKSPRTIAVTANDIDTDSNLRSAQNIAESLSRICESAFNAQRRDNRYSEMPKQPAPLSGVVFQIDEKDNKYSAIMREDWQQTALKTLENLRSLADKIRAEQAQNHNKRSASLSAPRPN
ncbi:MAG: hypothetical protein ABTQ34_02495 [Bdellovibrionales bacterium]